MSDRDPDPVLDTATVAAIAIAVVLAGGIAGLFIVDLGSAAPDPVDFDETVSVGLTLEDEMRLEDDDDSVVLPRTQVFYSQYPYVVGYYGVEPFVASQRESAHEQRFGFPQTAYVTDYADTGIELTDEGLPTTYLFPDWITVEEAFYVVDSDARMPSGNPATVPFSDRSAAEAFADTHGGDVLVWTEILDHSIDIDDAGAVNAQTAERHADADAAIEAKDTLYDRPAGTVVGEDEPTLQDAIDDADPDTTVVIPEGTYDGPIQINNSVTLRGEGDARIAGDGNGTVLYVNAPRTAIVGVNISGVGDTVPGPEVTDDHAHGGAGGGHDHGDTDPDADWDAVIDDDYAGGDTAIAVNAVDDVFVADTEIHTDGAGIILRDSDDFVVRNTTVIGADRYRSGHMGVAAMRSVGVVENSTFVGGLDGVYTHRTDGIVVRSNEMRDNRMGVHLMFTSDALLADNTISGQETTGLYVMTGPQRNAIVGNEITDTPTGLSVGGADTYVADNVIADNWLGVRIDASASIFEGNAIVDNRAGVETWTLLPTNQVTHNDFVGNEDHVAVSSGRLRVWTHDGEGNYWEGAIGTTDGTVIQRPYTPTDPVDSRLHRVDGTGTIAQAPALDALSGFEGAVPGMRSDEVIDTAPLCSPVNEAFLERADRPDTEPICHSKRHPEETAP